MSRATSMQVPSSSDYTDPHFFCLLLEVPSRISQLGTMGTRRVRGRAPGLTWFRSSALGNCSLPSLNWSSASPDQATGGHEAISVTPDQRLGWIAERVRRLKLPRGTIISTEKSCAGFAQNPRSDRRGVQDRRCLRIPELIPRANHRLEVEVRSRSVQAYESAKSHGDRRSCTSDRLVLTLTRPGLCYRGWTTRLSMRDLDERVIPHGQT